MRSSLCHHSDKRPNLQEPNLARILIPTTHPVCRFLCKLSKPNTYASFHATYAQSNGTIVITVTVIHAITRLRKELTHAPITFLFVASKVIANKNGGAIKAFTTAEYTNNRTGLNPKKLIANPNNVGDIVVIDSAIFENNKWQCFHLMLPANLI